MPESTFPTTNDAFGQFLNAFATTAAGDPPAYGLTVGQTDSLTELSADYAERLAATKGDARGPVATTRLQDFKASAIERMREIVAIVQATPTMTDDKRRALNINIRDREPTPVPAPQSAPLIQVTKQDGRTLTLRMIDAASPGSRARPAGVQGVQVLSYVGDEPPTTVEGWTYQGGSSKTTLTVSLSADLPHGARVWVTAVWANAKFETGPVATPIDVFVGGSQTFTHAGTAKPARRDAA